MRIARVYENLFMRYKIYVLILMLVSQVVVAGEDIYSAIRRSDISSVKKCVNTQAAILLKAEPKSGLTPLHIASIEGDLEIVRILLDGSDINAKDIQGLTPIKYSIIRQHRKITTLLAEKGGKIDIFEAIGLPDNNSVLDGIIKSDATAIRTKLKDGQYPIHWAAQYGNQYSIETLIKNHADLDALWVRGVYSNSCDSKNMGTTALHLALELGRVDIAQILIQNHARVDIQNCEHHTNPPYGLDGTTALHVVVYKKYCGLLDLICQQKYDVNVKDLYGLSPLHYAVRSKDEKAVSALLVAGADVLSLAYDERTPLEYSLSSHDMFNLLLPYAKEKISSTGWRLMRRAIEISNDKDEYISYHKMLIGKGVSISQKSKNGATMIWEALACGKSDIAEYLLAKGVEPDSFDLACLGYTDRLKNTIKDNPNMKRNGKTLLHYSTENGRSSTVEMLIKNNADVNSRDDDNRTPLHYAAQNGNSDIVRKLIRNGAIVDAKDNDGSTPLEWAAYAAQASTMEILLAKGADITGPLEKARRNYQSEVVLILNKYNTMKKNGKYEDGAAARKVGGHSSERKAEGK